jgi:hypothetical protein
MDDKIQEIIDNCEDLVLEIRDRQNRIQNSDDILKRVKENHQSLYPYEVLYQNYRNRYSNAYFSGSEFYRGDCYTDWILNQPFKSDKFILLFFLSKLVEFNNIK